MLVFRAGHFNTARQRLIRYGYNRIPNICIPIAIPGAGENYEV